MSYLDNGNSAGFFGQKMLLKTRITAFWICFCKENGIALSKLFSVKLQFCYFLSLIMLFAQLFPKQNSK